MTKTLSTDRTAALLAFIPAALSLVIVVHHPVLHAADRHSAAALAAGIDRIALANAFFHAGVLVLLAVQALGLYTVAERLDAARLPVRAGVGLYALATILIFVPGILDGFVTPLLATHCLGTAPCTDSLAGSLAFEWAAIQGFTRVALAVQALGLLSMSLAVVATPRWWAGLAGAVIAVAPLAMLATTAAIDPVRLAGVVAFEALWAMGAAAMLWTGTLPDPRQGGGAG